MKQRSKQWMFILSVVTSLLLASCSGYKNVSSLFDLNKSSCYHQAEYTYTIEELPPFIYTTKIDTVLSNHFSFESLNVANAIGLLDLLTKYTKLKINYTNNPTLEKRIELLEIRLEISEKINRSSLEISSVASELDCEEERANQIANFLKSKLEKRENNLVIGSIVIGAAGAIVAEGLSSNPSTEKSGSYVAVGASLIEATIGVLMLTNNKKVFYAHKRNTLREIWNAPATSKTLPPSIWYYLNYKDGTTKKTSLREVLVKNWTAFGQVNKSKKKSKDNSSEIYFGTGDNYSNEQLKNRADMYDQIEAFINLMKQDLKMLSIELEEFNSIR